MKKPNEEEWNPEEEEGITPSVAVGIGALLKSGVAIDLEWINGGFRATVRGRAWSPYGILSELLEDLAEVRILARDRSDLGRQAFGILANTDRLGERVYRFVLNHTDCSRRVIQEMFNAESAEAVGATIENLLAAGRIGPGVEDDTFFAAQQGEDREGLAS